MRLHRLTLRNVRGIVARDLELTDGAGTTGVVIVEGPNEAGKSTLGDALDALLAYKDSSRHGDVRGLKSADRDEPPEIVAELEVGSVRATYRKRFLKRPATELTITAPQHERLHGDDAHARMERILSEEIDHALWSSLRLRQGEGLDQARVGGTSGLAQALSGQGDAGAIGEAELAVLEQARTEHERYFTPRTGAPKPILRDARQRVADLTDRLADLDDRRSRLQDDIDRADRLARSLPSLAEQVVEADANAKEHADRAAEVAALAEAVADRERAERTADLALAHVRDREGHRRGLVRDLEAVTAEHEECRTQLAAAQEQAGTAARRLEAARTGLAEVQHRQRAARAARAAAQHDLDLLQDRQTLTGLQARARRAADALERARAARAEAAGIAVDDALLDELRSAQSELTRARAALDAASPRLRFTAARPVTLHEDQDGPTDLAAGEDATWTVHGRLALDVGELGRVEVTAGTGTEDVEQAHRAARETLDEALARGGVSDLAQAELAHRRRRDAERTAEEADRERALALEGTTAEELDTEVSRLEAAVAVALESRDATTPLPADLTAARAALDEAEQAERASDRAVADPEAEVESARAQVEQLGERVVAQRTLAEAAANRAAAIRAELADARTQASDEQLATEVADAERERDRAREQLEEARRAWAAADPDAVTSLADNAAQVAQDARARLQEAEQELREARARISALGGDGLWEQREELASELTHAATALEGLERRATAAATLHQTLERHRAQARERYAAPLREQLLAYGRMLYGPDFDVELDDDLRVARRHLDGIWLDVGALSVGAREQLALLGRLACATLLGEQGGLLLLDDALGSTDPDRLEALGAVLRLAGEHCQVVVLTCYPDRYRHVGGARRLRLDRGQDPTLALATG
jgi:hypothetical protein